MVVVATLILLAPTFAFADTCEQATQGWLDRCHQRSGLSMRVVGCPPGRVLLHVELAPATSLDLEISRSARAPFRRVNSYGLSPVGEFADWSKEPEARRAALDQVAACLERDPALALDAAEGPTDEGAAGHRMSAPWLLLGALVVLLASFLRRHRASRAFAMRGWGLAGWARNAWQGVGLPGLVAMLAGTSAVLAIRALAVPARFFHQNGQGPFWIEIALRDAGTCRYGPGYAELFGWVARWGNPPDVAIFAAMATGSALIPWFGWRITRTAGAPVCAAWVVAGLLAVHPLAIRLAQSESYLGVQLILLFAAAAVLAGMKREATVRSLSFILPTAAAGLLLAQAVRIHPTSWVPAATIPLVLICRRGSLRSRLLELTAAGLGIGAIVLAASGSAVSNVLSGSLGQQWQPSSLLAFPALSALGLSAVLASLGLVLGSRNRMLAIESLTVGWVLVFIAAATDLLGNNFGWIADAYRIQFAPPMLVACVGLTCSVAVRWQHRKAIAASATIGVLGVTLIGIRYEAQTVIPTDTRELRWAMQWRTRLPAGANVDYLARAEKHTIGLPVYDTSLIQATGRTAEGLVILPKTAGSLVFYYRSSLCSTPEGAPSCRQFERSLDLEPLETRVLPSQSSLPWLPPYDGPIEVGLFRVRGAARKSVRCDRKR